MSTLKAWRQVVTPHADIRLGKFDSSFFAADLGEVLAGRGAVDYRDAATFYAKTYLTEGISRLLIEVVQRLAGSGKTEPVIQLQTPFGDGKTHTLLTLYHLLKKPNEVGRLPQIKALLDAAPIKNIPTANVACLVGTALNAATDRTFWGEMAYQLGGERLYRLVARNDESKTAPGSTLLGQVLHEAGPCLILLDEILVYLPSFQRTRGVLRLLADLISDQYQGKVNEALIQSSSINLGAAAVRGELVKHTGTGSVFHSVVESDIAGKTAKAPEIDRQLGSEYAKESVAEKCARAVFLCSFGGGQQRGATLPQIRLAVLNPEMAPPFIADALDRMTKRLWYLYQDSGPYRFESRPNLNRILVDREELIRSEPDKVREFARSTLNDLIGDATFRVFRYPQPGDDRAVDDEPRLSLVVLDLNQGATEDGLPQETEALVTHILKQHKKGFRKHANVLVFLAPDQQRSSEVIDAARRLLALRNIDDDKPTKRQLSEEQLRDLADRLKEAEARLPAALATAYRHILVPADKKTVRCFDMGISSYSGRTTLSSKVLEKLIDEQQVLDKLDPAILIGPRFGLWLDDQEVINVRTLADYFTQLTHLPRLNGPQVLPECLARGVQRGLFGYALGDGEQKKFDTIHFNDKAISADRCEVTESAWLLRPALATALMPKKEPVAVVTTAGDSAPGTTGTTGVTGDATPGKGDGWTGGGGTVKIVKGERRLNKVRIDMKNVPWQHWNDVYNEVIDPLVQEGADLHCQVIIIAQGDAAIRENTVELGIKESLDQRGIKADIQTG